MSNTLITGFGVERSGLILMARILGAGGVPITQASVSALTYEYGYVDTPEEKRKPTQSSDQFTPQRLSAEAIALTIADVIYDTLQTGPKWAVTAAAPLSAGVGTMYVDPTLGLIPANTTLQFPTSAVTVTAAAAKGSRSLTVSATGNVSLGQKATANVPGVPSTSPWKVDDEGYNFLFELPWSALEEIPVDTYPDPRFYVVSIELTPTSGQKFGWEYRIETAHRLHGKWPKEA